MLVMFVWFRDLKKCKITLITLSIILAAILLTAAIGAVMDLISISGYKRVTATVTDFEYGATRDDDWTMIEYKMIGDVYTFKLGSHNNIGLKGSNVEIYSDPKHPKDIVMADSIFKFSGVIMIFTIPVGFFVLMYLINFLVIKRAHKKQQARLAAQFQSMNNGM